MIVVDEFNEIPDTTVDNPEAKDWEERLRALNDEISEVEMAILDTRDHVKAVFPSMRGYSMVITKLDEAVMWLHHEARADVLRKMEASDQGKAVVSWPVDRSKHGK